MAETRYDARYYRDFGVERQTRFDRARDDRVVALVGRHAPPPGARSRLLDIGCGYGHLLSRFADRYRLFGVDLSPLAASEARRRIPGAAIVTADVQHGFPFEEAFDVVLAINVVEHLEQPDAGVGAIARALAPGGICVAHLPTINGPFSRAIYRFAYAKVPTHVYRPSGNEVRMLFASHGLGELEGSFSPHRRWLGSQLGWHPALLAAFRKV